jgi:hypothetical protein
LLPKGSELLEKVSADLLHARRSFGPKVQINRSKGHSTANRIAQKSSRVQRFPGRLWPGVHDCCASDTGGEREPGSQAFSQTENVGIDPELLTGEQAAGPIKAGVNLIED